MQIVAEVGSNWSTLEDCKTSIVQAKACGADAVKFQLFSSEELYGSDLRPLTTSLRREWVPSLWEKAKASDIEFMCTPFSPDGLKFLDPFVKRHKIASSDLCHTGLLVAAASTGKPIILSTGGHSLNDVRYALDVLRGYREITLLYCESSYPAYHTDLRKLDLLREYSLPVGLSDHSREIYSIPLGAKERGCTVLEKHTNFTGSSGPDSPHSLNGTDFAEMVRAVRGTSRNELSLLSPYEADMVAMHNRRLIATQDIRAGEKLCYDKNYGVYRSTKPDVKAHHPALATSIHGKVAVIDIKQGDGIGPHSWEIKR